MRNKYGGDCYRCGGWVKPGRGYFERVPGSGWRVQHAECQTKFKGTKHTVTNAFKTEDHRTGEDIWVGFRP